MIENLWIIRKGVLIFSKNYKRLNISDDLLAGFLSAIDSFIKETTKGEIKNISLKDSKFTYLVGENLIIVLNTDERDNDILIQNLLIQIESDFLDEYREAINNNKSGWEKYASQDKNIKLSAKEYKEWRKAVFIRDNFTCQWCR
ncbi:hypothetical protein LCGC14_3034420, partial [marine sediment metagenome]